MNLFDLFKIKKKSTENYFDSIIKEKKKTYTLLIKDI